jgi:phenylacetate-CoA ligase
VKAMRIPYTKLKELYERSPHWLRRAYAAIPPDYRFGRGYREERRLIAASDRLTAQELRRWQERRLRRLVEEVLPHVPFYRPLVTPGAARDPWAFLRSLPLVDKAAIRENLAAFTNERAAPGSFYYTTTGGTTGKPFGFYLDNRAYGREWAFMLAQWERVGYRPSHRKATFRGVAFKRDALWQYNPVYNELQFSPFLLSEANLARVVDKLREYRPAYLHGYPSAVAVLARFVQRHGVRGLPPIRAVFGASENVYPDQRALIESALETRLFTWYGQSEKVILAGECERATEYHIFPQYGVAELVGPGGEVIEEAGRAGELIGTGFLNTVVPFVRYRTGDYAEYAPGPCACGRHYRLLKSVQGRWLQEMMIGRTGAPISITALNMHSDVFDNVHRFKFVQEEVGRARLLVVPAERFSARDEQAIRDALGAKVADELSVEIVAVEDIAPAESGKSLFLEQRLDTARYL